MVLDQRADEGINVIDNSVKGLELTLHCYVGRNLSKRRCFREAKILSHRVVVGQSMIASALDIDRWEVHAAGARRAKEKVPNIVDDERIHSLLYPRRKASQHRVDIERRHDSWIEESVS